MHSGSVDIMKSKIERLIEDALSLYALKASINRARNTTYTATRDNNYRENGIWGLERVLVKDEMCFDSLCKELALDFRSEKIKPEYIAPTKFHCSECQTGEECSYNKSWFWSFFEPRRC